MSKYNQKSNAGNNGSTANSAPGAATLRPYNQKSDYPDSTKDDTNQSGPTQQQAEDRQESRDDDRALNTAAQSGDQDNRGNSAMKTPENVDASFEDGQKSS